jgi:hypothetical protein
MRYAGDRRRACFTRHLQHLDDEPAPVREWLPGLAALLGAKPPRRIPKWLARIAAGEHIVRLMTEARAGSNAKAKRELFVAAKTCIVATRLCGGAVAAPMTRSDRTQSCGV